MGKIPGTIGIPGAPRLGGIKLGPCEMPNRKCLGGTGAGSGRHKSAGGLRWPRSFHLPGPSGHLSDKVTAEAPAALRHGLVVIPPHPALPGKPLLIRRHFPGESLRRSRHLIHFLGVWRK
jgi:hypothetical protein